MAGDGVGILDLCRIIERILLHFLVLTHLGRNVGIILKDRIKKQVIAFFRQGGRLALERIQQDLHLQLKVVIGQVGQDIGKSETIKLLDTTHTTYTQDLTVSDEIQILTLVIPIIIVTRHHQAVAGRDFLLQEEDTATDAVVVNVSPLVRPGNDNSLVDSVAAVGSRQRLNQFITSSRDHIWKAVEAQTWIKIDLTLTKGVAYPCGIEQDTGITLLTHNLGKPCLPYLKAITPQQVRIECRTLLLRHRR